MKSTSGDGDGMNAWRNPGVLAAAIVFGDIVGPRHPGTARTGACFALAPFAGALLAVLLLDERLTPGLLAAGALMGLGVWLHLTERHAHPHRLKALKHEHAHIHPHFPDAHYRHGHCEHGPVSLSTCLLTMIHRHRPLQESP